MLKVSTIQRDRHAVAAYGNTWYIDEVTHSIRENLGPSRPPFAFGDSFATLEEAKAAGFEGFTVKRLPETLKLPSQSPIINRHEKHRAGNIPLTRVTILKFDDLTTKGIRLNDHPIAAVDFALPPPNLIDLIDIVPSAIHIKDDPDLKINLTYQPDGQLLISDNPFILQNGTFKPWRQCMAFFHRKDGEREADRLSEVLRNAADWRSRSFKFTEVTQDEDERLSNEHLDDTARAA